MNEPRAAAADDDSTGKRLIQKSQWRLFTVLVGSMMASITLWLLNSNRQDFLGTGIYFVLVPGTLAALMAIVPMSRDQTTLGATRSTAIAILASAIIVREGFICVLMALPLILPIVALVVWAVRSSSASRRGQWLIPIALFGVSAEGVAYEIPPDITVTRSHVVDAEPDQVYRSFESEASLPELEPLLFKLPFPKPVAVSGTGAQVGSVRRVDFDTGGFLEFTVADRTATSLRWEITDRSTPMREWLKLTEATATWTETNAGLEITMEIAFERRLAPAAYFDPLERWGVGEMADVLLDMIEHNLVDEKP